MPDLDFKITGVEPAANGLTPLLNFTVEVTNTPATEPIQSVMLQAEKEKLVERHYAYGLAHGFSSREQTINELLPALEEAEVAP